LLSLLPVIKDSSSLFESQERFNIKHVVEWFWRRWRVSNFVASLQSAHSRQWSLRVVLLS